MPGTAHNQLLTRRDRFRHARTKASWDATVGQQISGSLYRGQGGQFTAGAGGGGSTPSSSAPAASTPAQQRQSNRSGERTAYSRAEDARRAAEDDAISREPNRTKRGALRRATLLARRARLYARREQRRQLDAQDQFARNQEAQERAKRTAERRAQRIAEVMDRREANRQAREARANKPKVPKPKKPTAEEVRTENRKRVRDEMAKSDSGLSPAGFDALMAFGEGATIDAVYDTGLREFGLLEGDPPHLTTAGNQAIRAANKGDYRAAVDAVNKGTERAKKVAATAQNKVDENGFRAIEDKLLSQAADGKARAALRRRFVKERRERKQRRAAGERVQPPKQRDVTISDKSFTVFKGASGRLRWISRTTTAFRDRDNEILSVAALERATARMKATGLYGPLRWWHLGKPTPEDPKRPWGPGFDLGMCDTSMVVGRTLVESGIFYDDAVGMALAEKAADQEMSPGFFHAPAWRQPDGTFDDISIFERSPVPTRYGRASNYFTGFAIKEYRMNEQEVARKLAAFKAETGADDATIARLSQSLTTAEKSADAAQVAYKEAPEEALLLLIDGEGNQYTVKENKLIALKAAPMPEAEVAVETTEVAGGEVGMEDEALLGPADYAGIAEAVVGKMIPFFDLHKQVGDLKQAFGSLQQPAQVATKEGLGTGHQAIGSTGDGRIQPAFNPMATLNAHLATKAAEPTALEALQAQIASLTATVKSLQDDAPLAAGRATQSAETVIQADNPLLNGYKAVADDPDSIVANFMNGFMKPN